MLITDEGETFFDSPVIAGYLETLGAPPALLPPAGLDAVRVRQTEALADGVTDAAVAALLESRRPDGERSEREIARQKDKIDRGLAELERRLDGRHAFNGGPIQLGDIAVAVALGYLDLRFPDARLAQPPPGPGALRRAHVRPRQPARHPAAGGLGRLEPRARRFDGWGEQMKDLTPGFPLTLAETKSHLSAVVDQVIAGEEIVITRRGRPSPASSPSPERDAQQSRRAARLRARPALASPHGSGSRA